MKLTILGTGNAQATQCYNTCFVLENGHGRLLVDGGGGNGLFAQLSRAGIDIGSIRHIFVTHKHIDHLLGIVWMVRRICQSINKGSFEGEACLYGHEEVIAILSALCPMLLGEKIARPIGGAFHFITVGDGQTLPLLGCPFTFFDIRSTKARQFGFTADIRPGERLVCLGDEPLHPACAPYARGARWLLHDAFCLDADEARLGAHQKHHATVKEACRTAEEMGAEHLILYHTEDGDLPHRKRRYTEEGQRYYRGRLFVPDDLDTFIL